MTYELDAVRSYYLRQRASSLTESVDCGRIHLPFAGTIAETGLALSEGLLGDAEKCQQVVGLAREAFVPRGGVNHFSRLPRRIQDAERSTTQQRNLS